MLLTNGRKWTKRCKCGERSSPAGRSKGIFVNLKGEVYCVCSVVGGGHEGRQRS